MGIFHSSFNRKYNSLVSYTPPHLCQPTEQKGWDSPQLQSLVQHHSSLPKLLAHMPGLPADSEACTHEPIETRVNRSSPAHYNFVSYVGFPLWLISVSGPWSAWGQWSVLIEHLLQKTYVWKLVIGFFNWATKPSWILQLFYSQVYFSFISEIQVVSSLLGDHFFFTCHLTQWCLEPNHVSCSNCKINNIYILLFQDLEFCCLDRFYTQLWL